jgi:pimeloyl-ACP methyl ester carboxylesterase
MGAFAWRPGEAQFLQVGGKRLEAVCHGPGPAEAPTLILLHEGLGSVSLWRDFPQRLAAATGFGAFAWSRAGYGQSDPADLPRPLDYMSREAMDCLPKVLDAVGVNRAVLLGHSDGASIAAIHAGGAFDPRVRGLVLIAPHFFTEPEGLGEIRKAKLAYETGDLRARLARHHRHVDNAFYGWNDAWLDPGFAAWNIAGAIDHLRVPVLAIQGVGDQYGTIAQIGELERRSHVPVEAEFLKACRHSPHTEQPERTVALIADFCRRLERIEQAAANG